MCIVGGGFTGLWTALELKRVEPSLDVVVVEADVCGTGASGRNGGFAMTFWHHFIGLERVCGATEAVRLARASDAAVAGIGEFCDEHGIQAHYRRAGWFWTATNQAQVGAWESTIAAIERQGEQPFQRMDRRARWRRVPDRRRHLAGVFEPGSATVQPGASRPRNAPDRADARRAGVRALAGGRDRASRPAHGAHGSRTRHRRARRGRDGGLGESDARVAPGVRDRLERHRHHGPGDRPAASRRICATGSASPTPG